MNSKIITIPMKKRVTILIVQILIYTVCFSQREKIDIKASMDSKHNQQNFAKLMELLAPKEKLGKVGGE